MRPGKLPSCLFALIAWAWSAAALAAEAGAAADFAITGVELIDGTGAPARHDMTIVVQAGRIAAVGPSASTPAPAGSRIVDGRGRTLVPGFVMVHEHLFYPDDKGGYVGMADAFAGLYLAGGATTIRTAGGIDPDADLRMAGAIAAGERAGPDIDVSGAYLDGHPASLPGMQALEDAEAAAQGVDAQVAAGATSLKVYEHVPRDTLAAIVRRAHAHGLKVTGHLCAVSYAEAAGAGIDNIEHGFSQASDFVAGRAEGACPPVEARLAALLALDPAGAEIGALIDTLVRAGVAVTATLGVFETMGRDLPLPDAGALDLLAPGPRRYFDMASAAVRATPFGAQVRDLAPKHAAMLRRFDQAGGLLLSGSDPTGIGGVLPGFSARREFALLVEGGFAPVDAIRIMTLNGARYLGRADTIGSIAPGKRADLVLIGGSLSEDPGAIERIETVFKAGIGADSAAIIAAMRGRVGAE